MVKQQANKLNKEFIIKQLGKLYEEALDSVMGQIDERGFTVSDDDNHNVGTNRLGIIVTVNNQHQKYTENFNDVFRKHQFLGKGDEIPYDNTVREGNKITTPLQASEENRKINQVPLKKEENYTKGPNLNDKIEIEKGDATFIITNLASLNGYIGALTFSQDGTVIAMIKKLANLVNPK